MKKCIVTGAAGFAGANLVELLLKKSYFVYAVVCPDSAHNIRLRESESLKIVPLDMINYNRLEESIPESCEYVFHLAWQGGRHDFAAQYKNIAATLDLLKAAKRLGCQRFIVTGSQAEYGPCRNVITEDTLPQPVDAYGSAKLATCILSRQLAADLHIDWLWGRIFSLYGRFEPHSRMLPALVTALKEGKDFSLNTDGSQYWDFLAASDGARALLAMAEQGRDGEIYNIANGKFRQLREFTEMARQKIAPSAKINYAQNAPGQIIYSLRPQVDKLAADTGWQPQVSFADGIGSYEEL